MKHLVIGYKGSIGSRHYRLLQEAGEEVVGIDLEDQNSNELLDQDVWWICVPEDSKEFYVNKGIELEKKIFVEKPYGGTVSSKSSNIWVACNYRFHPAVQILKENLHKVGEVLYSRMHFSHYLPYQRENWKEYMQNTNIVMDVGWHFIDLALWLFGESLIHDKHKYIRELDNMNSYAEILIGHGNKKDKSSKMNTFIWCDYLRRDKSWGIEVVGKEGTLYLNNSLIKKLNKCNSWLSFIHRKDWELLFCEYVYPDEMYKNQLNYLLKNEWKSNIDEAMEVMKICS